MPSLTAKAFAELIHTPLYGQLRILREQKYPRQAPAIFKVRYYQPALRVIRRFFQQGNDPAIVPGNAAAIPGVGNKADRIDNNSRTLTAFMNGSQSSRLVTVLPADTYAFDLANVTVKATPEFIVEEGNPPRTRFLIYDCREQRPEEEIIRTTVELFHHGGKKGEPYIFAGKRGKPDNHPGADRVPRGDSDLCPLCAGCRKKMYGSPH